MSSSPLPEGFTVACIEGKWYPLEVQRRYSSLYPDGSIWLCPFYQHDGNDVCYRTKKEAIVDCQQQAQFNGMVEREQWERLVEDVEGSPERRAWYVALIEQARDAPPLIARGVDGYSIYVSGSTCPDCEEWAAPVYLVGPTLDEVVAQAAERVYAARCACERTQEQRLVQIVS